MRLLIAADHAGFDLKAELIPLLASQPGLQVEDLGTTSRDSCDYPQYAVRVAQAVAQGTADLGILICGTGIGMCVAANKVPGAIAARCEDCYSARMARAHNAANILCLGGRTIGPEVAKEVVRVFLATEPEDEERLVRRRQQVRDLDAAR